ncbi:hypothetical protein C8Q76DRAFT_794910 [Earliella scabrosa]|nr:hypothetical protein C8Q76DRAFT_794910 [Earliella scabrosa]
MILSLPHTPDPGSQQPDDVPIIDVAEDSKTLDALLRICYPINKNNSKRPLELIESALKAAMKYEMGLAISVLSRECIAAAEDSPYHVWAVACRLGLEDIARRSAELSRSSNTFNSFRMPTMDFRGVNAGDYFRLREFKRLQGLNQLSYNFRMLKPGIISDKPAETQADTSPPPEFTPDTPFPDLVCRSADGLDCHVHRGIVAAASPVLFEQIKALLDTSPESSGPRADPSSSSPNPTLQLEESSAVLAALLRMCYPATIQLPCTPEDYVAVHSAAHKYQMEGIYPKLDAQWRTIAHIFTQQGTHVAQFFRKHASLAFTAPAALPESKDEGSEAYVQCDAGALLALIAQSAHWCHRCSTSNVNFNRLQCGINGMLASFKKQTLEV